MQCTVGYRYSIKLSVWLLTCPSSLLPNQWQPLLPQKLHHPSSLFSYPSFLFSRPVSLIHPPTFSIPRPISIILHPSYIIHQPSYIINQCHAQITQITMSVSLHDIEDTYLHSYRYKWHSLCSGSIPAGAMDWRELYSRCQAQSWGCGSSGRENQTGLFN